MKVKLERSNARKRTYSRRNIFLNLQNRIIVLFVRFINIAPGVNDKVVLGTGRDVILKQIIPAVGIIGDHPNDFRSGSCVLQEPRPVSTGTRQVRLIVSSEDGFLVTRHSNANENLRFRVQWRCASVRSTDHQFVNASLGITGANWLRHDYFTRVRIDLQSLLNYFDCMSVRPYNNIFLFKTRTEKYVIHCYTLLSFLLFYKYIS